MANKPQQSEWYHRRAWAAAISVVALISCYVMASLAIDSGSLLQYFIAVILLVLSLNRLAHIMLVTFRRIKA